MDATTKNTVLSAAILAHLLAGRPLAEAVDAVLGQGTHAALAGEVYDRLNEKAQALQNK